MGLWELYENFCIITTLDVDSSLKNPIGHRWQTEGPWAKSSLQPCFIQPSTLFLPGSSAELLTPS